MARRRAGWWPGLALALVLAGGCVLDGGASPTDPSAGDGATDGAAADGALLDGGADVSRPPRDRDAGPPPEDLDGFIEWQMAQGGVPGLAAAILRDGEVVWTGLYGWADVESETPVSERTLFQVGSISKTVTLVPLLRLVEDGVVDLDAPASAYLGFELAHPGFPDTTVTPRMLLTHTSGMQDVWSTLSRVTEEGDPSITLEQLARDYTRPGGELYTDGVWGPAPMTDRDYCNAGFAVAGRMIEVAGGAPFREQTATTVFEPLGMTQSGWFLADIDEADLATLYTWNDARRSFLPLDQVGFAHYPAGLLRTSLADLSRFLAAFMNGGELDGTRILSTDTVQSLWELQVPSLSIRQGLVWSWGEVNAHAYIGHGGATIGGSAEMHHSPDDGIGLILMTNGDSYVRAELGFPDGRNALQAILRRLDEEARR